MKQKTILMIVFGALLAGAIVLFGMSSKKSDVISEVTPDPVLVTKETGGTTTPVTAPITTGSAVVYKDGTYAVVGEYTSPAGAETIHVSLSIKDGIVTSSTVVGDAQNSISKRMQADFIANYKQFVIGKKISDLSLSKISGSSLTPKGFNDALVKIKTQAKA